MPTDAASSIQSEPAQGEGLVSISRRRDRSVTRIVTLAVIAVLIICPVVRAADYLEKTDSQKSRAFSPAVVTDRGRIV